MEMQSEMLSGAEWMGNGHISGALIWSKSLRIHAEAFENCVENVNNNTIASSTTFHKNEFM